MEIELIIKKIRKKKKRKRVEKKKKKKKNWSMFYVTELSMLYISDIYTYMVDDQYKKPIVIPSIKKNKSFHQKCLN